MREAEQLRLDPDQRSLLETTFVVLDLETTGLKPEEDRITEVGAVKVRGGEVLGEFQTLVRPGTPVPAAITAVTGIADTMLVDAPRLATVLPMLLEFLHGSVFVAHNARFDLSFLDTALVRHGYPKLALDVVDTARLARRLVRDETRDLRLATLARFFRSPVTPVHRALADARATVHVLHGLLERAGARGVTTVEDLLDQQRSRSDPAFRKRTLADGAPDRPGVYRFRDGGGRVLYVGTAGRLRTRLRSYFGQDDRAHVQAMVREAADLEWTVTPTSIEAEVRELRELLATRPRFNRRSTRPRAAAWVRLTDEAYPRLQVSGRPPSDPDRGLGPLPGRRAAAAVVEALESAVRVRTCTFRIRLAQDHGACALKEMGRCGAPCDGTASREAYARDIAPVAALLAGDPASALEALRVRVEAYAATQRFEEAAAAREALHVVARRSREVRDAGALVTLERLEVGRPKGDHLEGVRIRAGRLTASARVVARHGWSALRDALDGVPDDLPDGPAHEDHLRPELRLLARWVARPDARVLAVDGDWALPVAGGAVLADVLDTAAQVDRAVRRDRDRLRGRKVRHGTDHDPSTAPRPGRTGSRAGQTSSNQDDHASGAETAGPGSRPSHVARTR